MKTAIYIEDNRTQIILTPENDFEVETIKKIINSKVEMAQYTGSFSDCGGGWIRHFNDSKSLMLLLEEKQEV